NTPGNAKKELSKQYGIGSQILRPTYRGYFLNEQNGVKRLMYRNERDSTTVFADNVEDFQLMFGVDSTGDRVADKFVSGTTIASDGLSYGDVLSVEVSIRIASSATNIVDEGIPYIWNGGDALLEAEDQGRLRRVFSSVSTIRSKFP
ncbi:MAG: PilW family protein, partial [Saccharospirillum sp.]